MGFMPVQPLQSALDALRERMQAELEAQLADIGQRHAEALADARRSWEAEARQGTPVDDSGTREHPAPHPDNAPSAQTSGHQGSRLQRLRDAHRALTAATSLKEILGGLAAAGAAEVPRSALFVLEGSTLVRWADSWSPAPCPLPRTIAAGEPHPIAEAVTARVSPVSPTGGASRSSSSSSATTEANLTVALPILVEGETVAVLYGEGLEGQAGEQAPPWQSALEILVQHASACLALHTAVRTLQAIGVHREAELQAANPVEADGGSARRYARLLVSEIKLYNEAAVRAGRERHDLLARLGPEIERARRLYEERVPTTIFNRAYLFEQELVQTLAEGDPDLLGEPAR
jgi:hypothetical protein